MMGSMPSSLAKSKKSKGDHGATRLWPQMWFIAARCAGGPRQSFHRRLCDTVPPWRMTLMPSAFKLSAPDFSAGSAPTRPQAPGCSHTKPTCAAPACARPITNSPPQRTHACPGLGPKRPQSTPASLPGAMPSHEVAADAESAKSTRCQPAAAGAMKEAEASTAPPPRPRSMAVSVAPAGASTCA